MSFYKISKGFDSPWCNDDFDKLQESRVYEEKIVMDKFWENNETILLIVRNFDEATDTKDWEYQDFFEWKLSSPNAYTLVVSNKMREIIDRNLNVPMHRYYDCVIENYRLQESSVDYSVLHFIHNYYDDINYEKSEFGVINIIEEKLISKIPLSIANSQPNIIAENQKQKQINRFYGVKPLKLALTKDYDMIGANNMIYISPKARQLFIDNNLTGIDFIPYTSEKISSTTVPEIVYEYEL